MNKGGTDNIAEGVVEVVTALRKLSEELAQYEEADKAEFLAKVYKGMGIDLANDAGRHVLDVVGAENKAVGAVLPRTLVLIALGLAHEHVGLAAESAAERLEPMAGQPCCTKQGVRHPSTVRSNLTFVVGQKSERAP